MKYILIVLSCAFLVNCQPPHPDVVAVRQQEEHLPPHLRSPVLHNPNLQEVLPLTSLLHNGEKLVYEREANKVSRNEIYNILTHAGFISRQKYAHLSQRKPYQYWSAGNNQKNIDEPLTAEFPIQDYLQYL
ncbi:uncharacterized protein LOC114252695 [Bombyx mandarina]|uniref:Uncharacterized protein n=2 Tax=Bombyx TaxID=7090 RepID=A0A8R1WKR8_BOMMO|nr:uncharacterized protein LOC101744722 [Bombyx mori]XP_028043081.1 uncharacterized protein LOC114252695 [Bombyx mandarina]